MALRTAQVCTAVHANPMTWIARALWILLPVTIGGLIGDAATSGDGAAALAVSAWAVWAIGLFSSVVLAPVSLTVLRIVAPLPLFAGAVAAVSSPPDLLGWVGLAVAAAAVTACMSAEVGTDFVNGSAYGDERRVTIRIPSVLLAGPVELVWALTALPLPAAVLLGARGGRVAAVVVGVAGAALAVIGFRILHRLAGRWLVLVPAGITIVDPMALAEPILLRRTAIVRLGPAPVDSAALDLTVGAAGLILEADLSEPVELVQATRRGQVGEPVEVSSVLIAPSRPGRLLAMAEDRRIAVGRT